MTEPRYQQIAAEIRDRIRSGQLREGDLAPSARRISRDWGVASGTAARVLGALSAEGLTRGVPGVGTVVTAVGVAELLAGHQLDPMGRDSTGSRDLEVWADDGRHVQVGHGQRCVALVLHDAGRAAVGGLVLRPSAARDLAVLLIEQAADSERVQTDP
jgi:DNA-binding transcriptional MocR family regulator